jgi:hypothetical protein
LSLDYWSVCPAPSLFGKLGLKSGNQLQFKCDLEQNTFWNLTLASKVDLWKYEQLEKWIISLLPRSVDKIFLYSVVYVLHALWAAFLLFVACLAYSSVLNTVYFCKISMNSSRLHAVTFPMIILFIVTTVWTTNMTYFKSFLQFEGPQTFLHYGNIRLKEFWNHCSRCSYLMDVVGQTGPLLNGTVKPSVDGCKNWD